jgi:D-3-phosphoglycerate dehydrogenase / 2-oxoglutarate reductase
MRQILIVANRFSEVSTEPVERLKREGWEVVEQYHEIGTLRDDVFSDLIKNADAVIVSATDTVSARVIDAAKKLKIISVRGVGYQGIDIDAANQKKIMVTNTPGGNADAAADLTLGFMIALARQIPMIDRRMRRGEWYRIGTKDVYGQTLGLLGLGEIGKKVVQRAAGFDMKIIAYDIVKDLDFAKQFGVLYVTFDEVLRSSDFISIHMPLTKSTEKLIGEAEFLKMKDSAFIINNARGGIIDEKALYQALKAGYIAGAACDVFAEEPTKSLDLLGLDTMISTPHIGGYSDKSWSVLAEMAVENVIAALKEQVPPNLINREVLDG